MDNYYDTLVGCLKWIYEGAHQVTHYNGYTICPTTRGSQGSQSEAHYYLDGLPHPNTPDAAIEWFLIAEILQKIDMESIDKVI